MLPPTFLNCQLNWVCMVAHLSTWNPESGGLLQVWCQFELHIAYQTSKYYTKDLVLKNQTSKNEEINIKLTAKIPWHKFSTGKLKNFNKYLLNEEVKRKT